MVIGKVHHGKDSNPGYHICEPTPLPLSRSPIESVCCWFAEDTVWYSVTGNSSLENPGSLLSFISSSVNLPSVFNKTFLFQTDLIYDQPSLLLTHCVY